MNYADLISKGYEKKPDGSWGKRSSVRPVEANLTESAFTQALARRASKQSKRKVRVECVVTIIAVIRRELDSDNLQGSIKAGRDAIAESLGIDDGDKRIRWEYGQVETKGDEGLIVKIERL